MCCFLLISNQGASQFSIDPCIEEIFEVNCVFALLEELDDIIDHLLKTDSRLGKIDSVQSYVDRSVQHLLTNSMPLAEACTCNHSADIQNRCRWHTPHLQFVSAYAASMIVVDLLHQGWKSKHGDVYVSELETSGRINRIVSDENQEHHDYVMDVLLASTAQRLLTYKEH